MNVNLKLSGLYSNLFVIIFSLIFQKNLVVGGTEKSQNHPCLANKNDIPGEFKSRRQTSKLSMYFTEKIGSLQGSNVMPNCTMGGSNINRRSDTVIFLVYNEIFQRGPHSTEKKNFILIHKKDAQCRNCKSVKVPFRLKKRVVSSKN